MVVVVGFVAVALKCCSIGFLVEDMLNRILIIFLVLITHFDFVLAFSGAGAWSTCFLMGSN